MGRFKAVVFMRKKRKELSKKINKIGKKQILDCYGKISENLNIGVGETRETYGKRNK